MRGVISKGVAPVPLGGGRTNELWRVELPNPETAVLKRFAKRSTNPLFPNDAAAEARALRSLAASSLAPRILSEGTTLGRDWILLTYVEPVDERVGPEDAARTLAKVHALPPWSGLRQAPVASTDVSKQAIVMLEECDAALADKVHSCRPIKSIDPSSDRRLIHTDPVPANFVVGSRGPVLVDWQCPAFGDPVEDLATYLSPAMQIIYAGEPLSDSEQRRFLDAYPDPEIVERYQQIGPWFQWRIAAYCAWQATRGQEIYRDALPKQLDALATI